VVAALRDSKARETGPSFIEQHAFPGKDIAMAANAGMTLFWFDGWLVRGLACEPVCFA